MALTLALPWPLTAQVAYNCDKDSALAHAPPTGSRDTAGLGARIQASFPGYRLMTEREVVCIFNEPIGFNPAGLYPGLGTGRAWWLFPADFDMDGRTDIMTLLVRGTPAGDTIVVAFHGNGLSYRVAPYARVSNDGLPTLLVKGDTLSEGEGTEPDRADSTKFQYTPIYSVLSSDAIAVGWYVFQWQDGRYVVVHESD